MVKFLTLGSLLLASANWATVRGQQVAAPRIARRTPISAQPLRWSRQAPCCFATPRIRTRVSPSARPEGKLVAYSQVCTHLSCAVVYDKAENGLFCPCHHGLFNLAGQPIAGPPTRPLPRVQLEQRGDKLFAVGMEVV